MKNKKVLIVCTTDNMVWQFLIPHIKFLEKLGNKVDVACNRSWFFFDELKEQGINVHEINFARNPLHPRNLSAQSQLKALVRENKYDLIWCHQPVGGVMGRRVGKKFKIPVVYTAHGFHFFAGAPLVNRIVYKTIEKHYAKCTDALVTMNDEDYENAKKFKAKRVYKINGIGMDFNKYQPINESKEEIRESLNLSKDDFVIVTVAEFIKRKNYDTMLKAVKELKDNKVPVKYLICGKGKLEKEIKEKVNELGIGDVVNILGFRKDINRILTAADLFMIASFHEGLTLSVIEAMSYGLPCVVSDVRGNRDLVHDGKGGYVCSTKNPKEFALKIKQIASDKHLWLKFSKYNKMQYKQYDIEKVIEQMTKIFNQVKFK